MKFREYGNEEPYSDDEVRDVSVAALAELELSVDEGSGVISDNNPFIADFKYACQVDGGKRDARVETSTFQRLAHAGEEIHSRNALLPAFSFGGRLTKTATTIPLGTARVRPVFEVTTRTSPQGINDIQRSLGRNPGEDAFELVRMRGHSIFSAMEWLTGFANMQVPVAGLENDFYSRHDTNPDDHVQSWIVTPPRICQKIAEQAAKLLERPENFQDGEFLSNGGTMVQSLDELALFTKPLLGAVYKEAREDDGTLSRDVLARIKSEGLEPHSTRSVTFNSLAYLGISDDTQPNLEVLTTETTAEYMTYIAELLLALSEEQVG